MEQPVNFIRTQAEPINVKYTIRIDRDIEEASMFQEELATIRQSNEGDIVHLLINSGGGRLDTAKAFLNSIAQSQAHIITEIEGEACSAATLIFLAGDEYRVSDDASFMIHSASYGYYGKENNVRQYVEHQAKAVERLLTKYYRHFLTQEEIIEVINGRDMWMDADEIMERLEKRLELFQEEESEFMKQFEEDEVAPYTKEDFEDKSKEEILAMLFGEDETTNAETASVMNSDEKLEYDSVEDLMKDCIGTCVSNKGDVYYEGELIFNVQNTDSQIFKNLYSAAFAKELSDALGFTDYSKYYSLVKMVGYLKNKVIDSLNKD